MGRENGESYCSTSCPRRLWQLNQCVKLCRCGSHRHAHDSLFSKTTYPISPKKYWQIVESNAQLEILFPVGEIDSRNYRNAENCLWGRCPKYNQTLRMTFTFQKWRNVSWRATPSSMPLNVKKWRNRRQNQCLRSWRSSPNHWSIS